MEEHINDHRLRRLKLNEEEEEALSLCDLSPKDHEKKENPNVFGISGRSEEEEPQELFEFFTNGSGTSEMSLAEDIIFCGKLVPFKEEKKQGGFRRRSESFSGLRTSMPRSDSTKSKLKMRNSRSLDYRKLGSSSSSRSSPEFYIERNCSVRSVGKGDVVVKKTAKPRWFVLMFGVVQPPAEMELRDIKDRQARRNPSTMFPPVDAGKKVPINRNSTGKSPCGQLLKVLSCRDHASVAVATSFCMHNV